MLQNEVVRLGPADSANIYLVTQRICLDTARYCIEIGIDYSERQFIRLLLDTGALCHTTMDSAYRKTWVFAHASSACAAMCERVVEACGNFPNDDRIRNCARRCHECMKYCLDAKTVTVA